MTYYEELAHRIIEAWKFPGVQSARRRTKNTGIIQAESEGLRSMRARSKSTFLGAEG